MLHYANLFIYFESEQLVVIGSASSGLSIIFGVLIGLAQILGTWSLLVFVFNRTRNKLLETSLWETS